MRLVKYVVGSTHPIDCSNALNLPLSCVYPLGTPGLKVGWIGDAVDYVSHNHSNLPNFANATLIFITTGH